MIRGLLKNATVVVVATALAVLIGRLTAPPTPPALQQRAVKVGASREVTKVRYIPLLARHRESPGPAASQSQDDQSASLTADDLRLAATDPIAYERLEIQREVVEPFSGEPRSEPWATEMEGSIAADFGRYLEAHPEVGVAMDDAECRASFCRLTLRFPDMRTATQHEYEVMRRRMFDPDREHCRLKSIGYSEDSATGETEQVVFVNCNIPG